jgi:hypothetical protein
MKKKQLIKATMLAFLLTCSDAIIAKATVYTTVSLPVLNSNLLAWTDGSAYSGLFPSSQAFTGVPFQLQNNIATGNNVYVAPLGNSTLSIGTSVFGATDVYTLINTSWGQSGSIVGSLTFIDDIGDKYTVNLQEGYNVRDHYYNPSPYVNFTTASYVTQAVWGINASGHSHLDMQNFVLPTVFHTHTLTQIQFSGINAGNPQGAPAIAGLTVAGVPEPSVMILLGIGIIGFAGRKFRKTVISE